MEVNYMLVLHYSLVKGQGNLTVSIINVKAMSILNDKIIHPWYEYVLNFRRQFRTVCSPNDCWWVYVMKNYFKISNFIKLINQNLNMLCHNS